MAFTTKLTDTLAEACDIARADDASLFAFILKDKGTDAHVCMSGIGASELFCVLAAAITELEEAGISRKAIFKIVDKSMKEAGPLKQHKSVEG